MLQSDQPSAPAQAQPAQPAQTAWYDELPEGLRGQPAIQKFKGPAELAEAYVGLEKLMGHPKEKLVVLPDDEAERQALAAKILGVPEPDKYDIPTDGLDEATVKSPVFEWFKGAAKDLRLPPAAARKLAEGWIEMAKQVAEQQDQERRDAVAKSVEALRLEWGPQFDARVAAAQRGLAAVQNLLDVAGHKGDKLVDVLTSAGLDSHPTVVKMFAEVNRFFREDAVAGTVGAHQGAQNASVMAQIEKLTDDAIKASALGDRERAVRLAEEATRLRALLSA